MTSEQREYPDEVLLKGQHRNAGDDPDTMEKAALLEYSEWLDQQGLIIGDGNPVELAIERKIPGSDMRTHSELVSDFLDERDEQ